MYRLLLALAGIVLCSLVKLPLVAHTQSVFDCCLFVSRAWARLYNRYDLTTQTIFTSHILNNSVPSINVYSCIACLLIRVFQAYSLERGGEAKISYSALVNTAAGTASELARAAYVHYPVLLCYHLIWE
jgi:hypothetical protein